MITVSGSGVADWCDECRRVRDKVVQVTFRAVVVRLCDDCLAEMFAVLSHVAPRTTALPAPAPATIDSSEVCAEPQDHLAVGRVLAKLPDLTDPAPALCAYCGDAIDMPRSRRTNDCGTVYCSNRCMAKGEAPPEPDSAPAPAKEEVGLCLCGHLHSDHNTMRCLIDDCSCIGFAPAPAVCEVCGGYSVVPAPEGGGVPQLCPACHGTGRRTP